MTTATKNVQITKSETRGFFWLESLDSDLLVFVKKVGGWPAEHATHTLYQSSDQIFHVATDKLTGRRWISRTYQEVK
jgi:hypothetical protein